jgi:hypothetical protein
MAFPRPTKCRLLAAALPIAAFACGIFSAASAREPAVEALVQGLPLLILLAAGPLWVWCDAVARGFKLGAMLALAVLIAPLVAIPYYFNQTREHNHRAAANLLLLLVAGLMLAGYWWGSMVGSGAAVR